MTAILAVGSNFIFQGKHMFRNNSAVNGAGIMLLQNSYLYLLDNTELTFIDNSASERGGAIYLDAGTLEMGICTVPYIFNDDQFNLHNNTAGTAGSSLFWTTPGECMMLVDSNFWKIQVQVLLEKIFFVAAQKHRIRPLCYFL